MNRINGKLLTDSTASELIIVLEHLDTQRSLLSAAKAEAHPKFQDAYNQVRAELMKRNINEVPQSMLDSCGYPDMGAYD